MNAEDSWYNILLNTNIKNINNTCLINKNTINICKNKQFWLDKFSHDNLPYLIKKFPINITKILIEYEKIYNARKTVIEFTNSILKKKNTKIYNLKYLIMILRK